MSSPISSVPSNCSNWPRTVAMPRCFTEKPTVEWAGSTVHVPAGIRVAAAVAVEFMLLLFVADAVASGSLKLLADATIAPRRPSAHGRNRRVHVLILRKSQSAGAAAGKMAGRWSVRARRQAAGDGTDRSPVLVIRSRSALSQARPAPVNMTSHFTEASSHERYRAPGADRARL